MLKVLVKKIGSAVARLKVGIKQRRPAWRFSTLTALIIAVSLLAVGLFYVRTNMRLVQTGYEIAELEKKNQELKKRKEELLVEISALQSPAELEMQAREKAGLVFPQIDKVVHVH